METLEKNITTDRIYVNKFRNPIVQEMVDKARYPMSQCDKASTLWHDYHRTYHDSIKR